MPKDVTVAKYRDEFLKGRNENYIEKFDARTVDQQYNLIMTWRHRRRAMAKRGASMSDVQAQLMDMKRRISELTEIKDKEFASMYESIQEFEAFLHAEQERRRNQELNDLERQQRELIARIEALKEKKDNQ